MRMTSAEVFRNLRHHPLQSTLFWLAVESFVGGGATRAFPQLFDVAFTSHLDLISFLASVAILAGGTCALVALAMLLHTQERGWPMTPYFGAAAVSGFLGFELMAAIL